MRIMYQVGTCFIHSPTVPTERALTSLSTVYPYEVPISPSHEGSKTKICLLAMLSRTCHCQGVRVRAIRTLGLSVQQGALLQTSGEPAMLAHLKNQQTLLYSTLVKLHFFLNVEPRVSQEC